MMEMVCERIRAHNSLLKRLRFRRFSAQLWRMADRRPIARGSKKEAVLWLNSVLSGKSRKFSVPLISLALTMVGLQVSYGQNQSPVPNAPGFSFQDAQSYIRPLTNIFAYLLQVVVFLWQYVMDNAPAAVLLSAAIAYIVARASINNAREIARLRETFNTIDLSIKDKDMIDVRRKFKELKVKMDSDGNDIAKYHKATTEDDIKTASSLNTILQDYENRALGVRYNILDEAYLHRWTRTLVIQDWNYLMPLVTAKRSDGGTNAYIEFEGLAAAWQQNISYRTGKKLKAPKRRMKIH